MVIGENTSWGLRKRFQNGNFSLAYSTFLGYDKGPDGKLVVNEEQAKTVRLIYNLYLSGMSCYKIKQELEKRHLKSPTGADRWHQTTVKSILLNEKYAGDALLQKYYTSDFLTKKKMNTNFYTLQQYEVTGDHEAIISHEQFEAVKNAMKEREAETSKYVNQSPITKKLVCGYCGEHFGRKTWHSTDKYKCIQYRCKNRYEGTRNCDNRNVREEVIKEEFVKALSNHIGDEYIKTVKAELKHIGDTSELRNELNKLNDKKAEKINKLNEIDDIYIKTGKDNNARFQLAGDIKSIDSKISEINDKINAIEHRKINIEKVLEALDGPVEFSYLLWEQMVGKAIVYKDRIEFEWKK